MGKKIEYSVYVIELNKKVLKHKKFKDANPNYDTTKHCVYVGSTELNPEERFKQHIDGHYKNGKLKWHSTYAKKYGIRLKPRLYKSKNPIISEDSKKARQVEAETARRLRNRGYGVWQN